MEKGEASKKRRKNHFFTNPFESNNTHLALDDSLLLGTSRMSCLVGIKRKRSSRRKRVYHKDEVEGEDVCFVCFDGGFLVVCDQKNCNKAYHPTCANVGEASLQTLTSWKCSRHICNECRKTAYHTCYTCTYSLCKQCMREPDFLCVRNEGFCRDCIPIVKLIEKNTFGNQEMGQVDFDDRNSRECLLRDYWIDLRGKLSFTSDELAQALNQSKRSILLICKEEPADQVDDANAEQYSNIWSSYKHGAVRRSKRRKAKNCSHSLTQKDCSNEVQVSNEDRISVQYDKEWACRELLDFVSCMRNGDTSVLPVHGVRGLLFQYIKQNNLRNPNHQGQILCDRRLQNLFGQRCIGHFEMLRKLSSHLIRKGTREDYFQPRIFDANTSQMEIGGTIEPLKKLFPGKPSKMRKGEHRSSETNHKNYAACDVLDTKNDTELLVKASADTRPAICSTHVPILPKTDLYNIAHRIQLTNKGHCISLVKERAYKKLKLLKRDERRSLQTYLDDYATIDVHNIKLLFLRRNSLEDLLEDVEKFHDKVVGSFVKVIINSSQKKEKNKLVQVVGTRRAHHPYTTGEKTTDLMLEILILSKTKIISISSVSNEELSVDDCERLRESIKSVSVSWMTVAEVQAKAMALQEVRSDDSSFPEGLLHRVQNIPEIHPDLDMGPNNKSQQDAESANNNSDNYMKERNIKSNSKGRQPTSSKKGGPFSDSTWSTESINSLKALEPNRNMIANDSTWNQEKESYIINSGENGKKLRAASLLDGGTCNDQVVGRSHSSKSVSTSFGSHMDESWHYQDPSGKIRGPFSMLQLLKWSTTSSFPANLRVWRAMEKKEGSILLTDAINNTLSHAPRVTGAYVDKRVNDISDHYEAVISRISQLTLSSTSSLFSAKPVDGQYGPGTFCIHNPNSSSLLVSRTDCDILGDSYQTSSGNKDRKQEAVSISDSRTCTGQVVARSQSEPASLVNHTAQLWHYQDLSGYVQGPFCILQLLKWTAIALFPPNLRVWRTIEKQEDSILLIDALNNFLSHPTRVIGSYAGKRVSTSDSDAGVISRISQPNLSSIPSLLPAKPVERQYVPGAFCVSEPNSSSLLVSQSDGDILRDSFETNDRKKSRKEEDASISDSWTCNGQVVVSSQSEPTSHVIHVAQLWHYQDPLGYVQGPFSMQQLLKWSASTSFPANLRVWRTMEKPEDAILLIDALNSTFSHPPKFSAAYVDERVSGPSDCDAGTFLLSSQPTLSSTASLVSSKPTEGIYGFSAVHMSETNTPSPLLSPKTDGIDKMTHLTDTPSRVLVEKSIPGLIQNLKKDLSSSGNDSSLKADSSKFFQTTPAVSGEVTFQSILTGDAHVLKFGAGPPSQVDDKTRPHDISASISGESQDFVVGSTQLKPSFPKIMEKGVKEEIVQDSEIDFSSSKYGDCIKSIPVASPEMNCESTCTRDSPAVLQTGVYVSEAKPEACARVNPDVDGKPKPSEILASMSIGTQGFMEGITPSHHLSLPPVLNGVNNSIEESKRGVLSSQHCSSVKVEPGTVLSPVVSGEMSFRSPRVDHPHATSWHDSENSPGADNPHSKTWCDSESSSWADNSHPKLCRDSETSPLAARQRPMSRHDAPDRGRKSGHRLSSEQSSGYCGNVNNRHNTVPREKKYATYADEGSQRSRVICMYHFKPKGCKYGKYCIDFHVDNNQNWRKSSINNYVRSGRNDEVKVFQENTQRREIDRRAGSYTLD